QALSVFVNRNRSLLIRAQEQAVHGGVVNFQVKHGASGWLPHLHAVLDQKGRISENWLKETWTSLGGGWSIKLKPITPGTQRRVLAYGARNSDLPSDPAMLRQFHEATASFISIRSWGTLHPLYGRKPRSGTSRHAVQATQ
ncbi:MAG: hypothetical protein AAB262_11330, partial [Elusimicrobiota bacterium]